MLQGRNVLANNKEKAPQVTFEEGGNVTFYSKQCFGDDLRKFFFEVTVS
jgi:hypothetical protein